MNQEQRYSAKLEEAEKRVKEANVKVYELQQKLDAVERDALLKEYNVERKCLDNRLECFFPSKNVGAVKNGTPKNNQNPPDSG